MAQEEFVYKLANGKKLVHVKGVAGPASYATNGFTVRVSSIRNIDHVTSMFRTTNRTTADTNDTDNLSTISGNSFLVKVMTQTVTGEEAAATWAELAAMTNISAVIWSFTVLGD